MPSVRSRYPAPQFCISSVNGSTSDSKSAGQGSNPWRYAKLSKTLDFYSSVEYNSIMIKRKKATEIITDELCCYGCGNQAKFINGLGKLLCSQSNNSCPANRSKNSKGVEDKHDEMRKKNGKAGMFEYDDMDQITKDRMSGKGKRFADFSYGGKGQHKNALISERGHQCENCKLTEWMGKPITLEMEHVDADRENNTRENLMLLCPNCHSQTPTWRRTKTPKWQTRKRTDEEIIEAISTTENIHQALKKLDLRWGSTGCIVDVMVKYKINFRSD
jgi:5-methylcytosine-specific restriction endonuclease McrA